jgi:hypothetical protein
MCHNGLAATYDLDRMHPSVFARLLKLKRE